MKEVIAHWLRRLLPFSIQKAPKPLFAYQHIFIQPCVINQHPHIVYPRGLKESSPGLYQKLSLHYRQQGYDLKEDRRDETDKHKYRHERRRLAPALLFIASLLFESSAHAEIEVVLNDATLHQNQQIKLQLVPNDGIRNQIRKQIENTQDMKRQTLIKSDLAQSIFAQLRAHYEKKETDPDYIFNDLRQIANYYSEFPEVVALLNDLTHKNWKLSYNEHDWVTSASGNIFEVKQATIHFNTRSAAQLKLNNGCNDNPVCIASPADALLHELLHTHTMLVKTDEFISQGGMNSVMYPYKHEYAVIKLERKLYARMSLRDAIKRPQRHEHMGRKVKAHCSTCIK